MAEEFWGDPAPAAEEGGGGGEEEEEEDDYALLEEPYEVVAEAFPKATETQIVAALRATNYDADLAILRLQRARAAKAR